MAGQDRQLQGRRSGAPEGSNPWVYQGSVSVAGECTQSWGVGNVDEEGEEEADREGEVEGAWPVQNVELARIEMKEGVTLVQHELTDAVKLVKSELTHVVKVAQKELIAVTLTQDESTDGDDGRSESDVERAGRPLMQAELIDSAKSPWNGTTDLIKSTQSELKDPAKLEQRDVTGPVQLVTNTMADPTTLVGGEVT